MENEEIKESKSLGAGAWILISVVLIYLFILMIAPIAALIAGTLRDGIAGLLAALVNTDFHTSFLLTLKISLLVTIIQAVLGTITAWVLARQDFIAKNILNGMIDVPFAVSPVVVGYMLLLLFGRNSFLGPILSQLGIRIAFAIPGMVLATLFVTMPFMIREMIPVIRGLDRRQELAAATLGASEWTIFWRVTFPALQTGLIYGMTLTLASALGEFGAVLVIGGGAQGQTETATLYIYRALEERQYVGAYSAALLIGLCTVILVAVADWLRHRSMSK